MENDYIKRSDAIKTICGDCEYYSTNDCEDCRLDRLTKIPAADVRPMVRGKWEKHEDFDTYGGGRFVEWVCSECDKRLRGDWVIRNSHIEETPTENYCPNCGADMTPPSNGEK